MAKKLREILSEWTGKKFQGETVKLSALTRTHFPPGKIAEMIRLGFLSEEDDRIILPLDAEAETRTRTIDGRWSSSTQKWILVTGKLQGVDYGCRIPLSGNACRGPLGDTTMYETPSSLKINGVMHAEMLDLSSNDF